MQALFKKIIPVPISIPILDKIRCAGYYKIDNPESIIIDRMYQYTR